MGSCITSKDDNLVEIICGVVIWNIWLERNRIIFKDGHVKHIQLLGSKIIAVAKFWAQNEKNDMSDKLNLILLFDVKDLTGTTLTISMA